MDIKFAKTEKGGILVKAEDIGHFCVALDEQPFASVVAEDQPQWGMYPWHTGEMDRDTFYARMYAYEDAGAQKRAATHGKQSAWAERFEDACGD